ncbi:MAG: TPM domain-containing protein [Gammaproteobacteria bacterium]|jgi:uncharacterized membrane protein
MNRYFANLLTTRFALRRAFPASVLAEIEGAVRAAEQNHRAQICFAIETALDLPALIRGVTPRDRAVEAFATLGVWDTAENSGVLIYVLLAEHDIEVVADRGYDGLVSAEDWCNVCDDIRLEFRQGRFREGALKGIDDVSAIIERHFPGTAAAGNELGDRPRLI